jgi:site-specific recombinase XerC
MPQPAINTFGTVVEKYLKGHVAGQRQAAGVERVIRRESLPKWRNRVLASITRADVIKIIDEIRSRGAKYSARNLLANTKVFFGWAVERGHIQTSPADRLKPSRLIGPASPRKRVLTDADACRFLASNSPHAISDRSFVSDVAAYWTSPKRSRRSPMV